ncbi:hypothetical protein LCGC14_2474030 [marine sediment metagenome]|uniref:Uncharacterized protein n=1 Tax=marine sediment metagenome TaxID=412755 RepID=A0A0F9E3E0_9ZZZZ
MAEETKTKEVTPEEVTQAMEQTTGSEEVVMKLDTGEVFKGKNHEEVAKKIAEAHQHDRTALRDREEQIRERDARLADLQKATETRRETTTASTSPQFNQQKFLTDVETDASEAITSALAHSLGYGNTDELRQDFKGIQEATESYKENYHIAVFSQRNPDYPGGAKPSAALMQELKNRGVDFTADNLENAWNQMKRSGDFKPLEIGEQETTTTTRSTAPVHLEGTRGAGGGGMNEDEEMMEKFGNMTVEQQEAFMKSPEYAALVERTQKQ